MTRESMRAAAGVAVLLTLASGCVERPAPFEPEERAVVRVSLPPGAFDLYERDSVPVVAGAAADVAGTVQLLLLDGARAVLWRSAPVPFRGPAAVTVPVEGIPGTVIRGDDVLLTAVATDGSGRRYYATDEGAAAVQLANAATRSGRIWAGRRVRVGEGGVPLDLVGAPELGRAYFPMSSASGVGVLDVTGEGRLAGIFPAGVRPEHLAYRSGRLVALGGGGGEISFMDVSATGVSAPISHLLPALELELDTTFLGAVRPSGRGVALGCDGDGCTRLFVAVPSGLQAISGALPHAPSPSVLRVVPAPDLGGDGAPTLVLPGYVDVLPDDTSAVATVFAAAAPQGTRAQRQRNPAASACLSTSLGGGAVAAGDGGALFVATRGAAGACGPGTGIVRIDGAGSTNAVVSVLGIRNSRAEDRVGEAIDLRLADDGTSLLVMSRDGVSVLDPALRVRGTLPLPGVRSVAWLRGSGGDRFSVATAEGVWIYDASTLTRVVSLPIGPTGGPLLYMRRPDGPDVVVAGIPGGFVVVTIPGTP